MWPWGHAALGYLIGRVGVPVDDYRGLPVVALLFGTQFPDLVDKPLAWTVQVLPSGRSLGHSVFVFFALVAAAWWVCDRYGYPELAAGFGIGYGSHLLGDSLNSLVALEFESLSFLVWPLLPPPPYETDPSFSAHFANLELTPWLWFEFGLVAIALAVAIQTEYVARR
jgi:membrane-bound metal-dependent hydrolase YbcI (DUF457 family)